METTPDSTANARSLVAHHAWALGFDADDPAGFQADEEVPTAGEACGRLAMGKGVWTCKAWVYVEAAHEAQAVSDPLTAEAIAEVIEHHARSARPRKGSATLAEVAQALAGCPRAA